MRSPARNPQDTLQLVTRTRWRGVSVALAAGVLSAACDVSQEAVHCEVGIPGATGETLISRALTGPCSIQVEPLGIVLGSDSVDPSLPVEHLASGRFVSGTFHQGRLAVWEPSGRLHGLLGRPGEGPGELRGLITVLYADGDSIHVVDATGRWTVFSTPDLQGVRQSSGRAGEALMNLKGTIFFPGGPVLVGIPPFHADGTLARFRLLDREGAVLRSFGIAEPEEPSGTASTRFDGAVLAKAGGGRFWAATPSTYRVELWDTAGVRHRVVERDVPWFRGATVEEASTGRGSSGLPIQIVGLREDPKGRLWVTVAIPTGRRPGPEDIRVRLFSEPELFYRWKIEVLDPNVGALLASADFARLEELPVFARSGIAYRYIESEDLGGSRVEFVRVDLKSIDP